MKFMIRPAGPQDLSALGRMAGALVRLHHGLDAKRFFLVEPIEPGYGKWLVRAAKSDDSIVLVAEADNKVVGYAWATLEERDWMMLRDECAALQDIWVDDEARRSGIARALIKEIVARSKKRGAPRLVLHTAAKNEAAQKFFESMGFRRTMIEMTRELGSK